MTDSKPKIKPRKMRLDQLLVERGLALSRERAKALVLAAKVVVGDHTVTKAGQSVAEDVPIRLKGEDCPYVSRGGLKLAGALDHFDLTVQDFTCLDAGASTGGFTDCLLQRGARKVYAFDVGTNQLAWSLRGDSRVISREGFHIKDLQREDVQGESIDLIVIDVSFISLTLAMPPLFPFIDDGARLLAMVKPQFEIGRGRIGKGGVVRDPALQMETVQKISEFARQNGYFAHSPFPATIQGPKGNQEYFLLIHI